MSENSQKSFKFTELKNTSCGSTNGGRFYSQGRRSRFERASSLLSPRLYTSIKFLAVGQLRVPQGQEVPSPGFIFYLGGLTKVQTAQFLKENADES